MLQSKCFALLLKNLLAKFSFDPAESGPPKRSKECADSAALPPAARGTLPARRSRSEEGLEFAGDERRLGLS